MKMLWCDQVREDEVEVVEADVTVLEREDVVVAEAMAKVMSTIMTTTMTSFGH